MTQPDFDIPFGLGNSEVPQTAVDQYSSNLAVEARACWSRRNPDNRQRGNGCTKDGPTPNMLGHQAAVARLVSGQD